MQPEQAVIRFSYQVDYLRRRFAYSTMENSASARPSFDGDDTVDEMMDALDGAGDPKSVYRGNGFTEKAVEPDQNEHLEELIAPEVLFPGEVDESG